MGSYGAGALWCLKEREGKYITFNNVRIARQKEDGTWSAIEPGWTVTKPVLSMFGFGAPVGRECSCHSALA
jgi:hypothetical protein